MSRSRPFWSCTSAVRRSFSRRSTADSTACQTVATSSCWCHGLEMRRYTSPAFTACSATLKSSAAVQRMRELPGASCRACLRKAMPSISGMV